jgi:hypothetical protein
MASVPSPCPRRDEVTNRSIPACRYMGSSSSAYWIAPTTSPSTSMTKAQGASMNSDLISFGSKSPHHCETSGSLLIRVSASMSPAPPGRRSTRSPRRTGPSLCSPLGSGRQSSPNLESDVELAQPLLPGLHLTPVLGRKRHVVEPRTELAERVVLTRGLKTVETKPDSVR